MKAEKYTTEYIFTKYFYSKPAEIILTTRHYADLSSVVGLRAPPLNVHKQHSASNMLLLHRAHNQWAGVGEVTP